MEGLDQTTLRGLDQPAGRRLAAQVPALTIAAHPQARRMGEVARLPGLLLGQSVRVSRLEPSFSPPGEAAANPIADPYCSRKPLCIRQVEGGGIEVSPSDSVVHVEVDGEPLRGAMVLPQARLASGIPILLSERVLLILHWVTAFRGPRASKALLGEGPRMEALHSDILLAAEADHAVLIRGATGVGKELVARALHEQSAQRNKAFVAVNMAAIPASTAAAELFGYRRGAFTGADSNQAGYFGAADGGTLFLDEIGDTPLEVQPLLLRALESGEIQSLGSPSARRVSVRVVAATDAQLETAVAEGRFRAPLYHRLAAHVVDVPPLFERKPDLPGLFRHFLGEELDVPASVVQNLLAYHWPGNVRELRNVALRCASVAKREGAVALPSDWLSSPLFAPAQTPHSPAGRGLQESQGGPVERTILDEVTEESLLAALKDNRWRIEATARQLGIAKNSLYVLMERSPHVKKAKDLTQEEIENARATVGSNTKDMAEWLQVSHRALLLRLRL